MHFLKELVVETQELLHSVHETFRNIEQWLAVLESPYNVFRSKGSQGRQR